MEPIWNLINGTGGNTGETDTTIADKFNNDNTGEIKIGDYVLYNPTGESATYTISNTYSGYDSGTEQTMTRNSESEINNLKWRVLDKKDEQIRLISDSPTTSTIYLRGAEGYNNSVKIIDDLCSTLYGNSTFGTVQSLKIEDIENKMNSATWDYHSYVGIYQYGTYGAKLETYKNYPNIFYQEDGQQVNKATHGTLALSEQPKSGGQTEYVAGTTTTATSITPKQTYWYKRTTNENQFLLDMYHELFIEKNGANYSGHWLASRCVYTTSTNATFAVRSVGSGYVRAGYLYDSNEGTSSTAYGVRPVVTLNSNVKVTGGDATSGWIIE